MGGFTNAISNALAARGNALAQGELQRGQVWGNLAQNLGQLPFQAMQAHQRRNLAEVETQQRGLQNQAMQQELNFQKEMSEIMTRPGLTPEQRDLEGMNTLKKYGKLEKFQEIQSRKTQEALLIAAQRKDTPGTMNPLAAAEQARAQGVPSPVTPLPPPPTQNAFAPQGPAVPYEQMPTPPSAGAESQFGTPVHPTIPLPGRQGEGLITPTPTQRIDEKVTLVRNSGLPPNVQEQIIATIYGLPPGVLSAQARGASVPGVGLTVIELTNPANSDEKIMVQSTRGGPFVHSGTQELVPEEIARTWTKRIVSQPHYFVGEGGQPSILDVEKLLAQTRNAPGNPVVADVPGVKVAETKTPLVDASRGVIAGEWGSRSGLAGMKGQGTPVAAGPTDETAPPAAPIELSRTPRTTVENNLRTYLKNSATQLQKIAEISKRRPDLIGQYDYLKAWGMRKLGVQKDPDANALINALNRFTEDTIRAKEGAVIPDSMYSRLEGIVSAKGWNNEEQFGQDLGNAMGALQIGFAERKIPWPTQGAAPKAPAPKAATGAADQINAAGGVKVKRKSDGRVTTVPAEAWNGLTPEQKALYEKQ